MTIIYSTADDNVIEIDVSQSENYEYGYTEAATVDADTFIYYGHQDDNSIR